MHAIDHLEEQVWEKPRDYAGFSPDGDYLVYAIARDSPLLDECNWEVIGKELFPLVEKYPDPEDDLNRPSWVYIWRAGHWAAGWVEYMMVRADAPEEIKTAAGEILCSLADYPILDESAFCEAQTQAVNDLWDNWSVRNRAEFIRDSLAKGSLQDMLKARSPEPPREIDSVIEDLETLVTE